MLESWVNILKRQIARNVLNGRVLDLYPDSAKCASFRQADSARQNPTADGSAVL